MILSCDLGMAVPKSLQCPRCNGSVSVADDAAGKRVKCPHCEQNFLTPGIAPKSSDEDDDDDWLTLNDSPTADTSSNPAKAAKPPQPASTNVKASPSNDAFFADTPLPPIKITEAPQPGTFSAADDPSAGTKKNRGPAISTDDEALLSQFTDTTTSPTAPSPAGNSNAIDAIRALGAASGTGSEIRPPRNPEAQSVEHESEFRVTCMTCGSMRYVKAADTGKTTTCNDCYSPITIPRPPKVRKQPEINIENAETFSFEQPVTAVRERDPFQKSADDLLAEAAREEEKETSPVYADTPNVMEWLNNIFGIFKDPGVLMHWVVLSVAAAIPTALLLNIETESMQLLLTLGMMCGGFILGAVTVSCAFAILLSVANHEERVEEWPKTDILQWFDQLILVLAASGLAAIPIWSICFISQCPTMLSVFITMFTIYLLLPFILLSMLDMNSIFSPFSPELARSVSKCQEEWGGFYFSTGLLLIGLFLFIAVTWSMGSAIGMIASIALTIGITFTYFGMLGRLAYSIGQAVNAPAIKNDIDRSRPNNPI